VGIECRSDDHDLVALLAPLNHTETHIRVSAERALNAKLNGGCQVPIGSFAELDGDQLVLRGMVGAPDGSKLIYAQHRGDIKNAQAIGVLVAEQLLEQGADEILRALYADQNQ
jgi:hydroxymethylbilane synthase